MKLDLMMMKKMIRKIEVCNVAAVVVFIKSGIPNNGIVTSTGFETAVRTYDRAAPDHRLDSSHLRFIGTNKLQVGRVADREVGFESAIFQIQRKQCWVVNAYPIEQRRI